MSAELDVFRAGSEDLEGQGSWDRSSCAKSGEKNRCLLADRLEEPFYKQAARAWRHEMTRLSVAVGSSRLKRKVEDVGSWGGTGPSTGGWLPYQRPAGVTAALQHRASQTGEICRK